MIETDFFSTYLLRISIALIMFGMGMNLTVDDFRRVFRHPKALLLGLIAQMIWLPILGLLIVLPFPVSNELKVGIILVAICPGGATSNLLNYLLNGNLALCVSLTSINSFLTQFTIPVLMNLSLVFFMGRSADIHLDFWESVIHIVLITALPVTLGILFRNRREQWAEKMRIPFKYILPALMGVALAGAIFLEKKEPIPMTWQDGLLVFPMALLLNVGGMMSGVWISRLGNQDKKTQMTIGIEVGLQNTTLAIVIALSFLKSPFIAIPAAIYALFSFFTTALFGMIMSGRSVSIKKIRAGLRRK
ncbi:MAG: bile acid:sodium symporter family protein [Candidatus Competibacteraceae bacterium]|nr:bile acid:sodium symporter family protein [Candidatus Competibacteraceae bacterium]